MKKVESLYSPIISSITNICDNDVLAEEYWKSLSEEDQKLFDDISEKMSKEKTDIIKLKRINGIYDNLSYLQELFYEFEIKFDNYPGFSCKKITYIIFILKNIFSNSSEIPDEAVSDAFSFIEINLEFSCKAFITGVSRLENNIAWLNPSSEKSIAKLISMPSDIEFWYVLMSLAEDIDYDSGKEIVVCRSDCLVHGASNTNVISLLKLHILSAGEKISPLLGYKKTPRNSFVNEYCPKYGYSQFEETINIISEYINREDVLSKYLSIYHVIENFMFKYPIVKLERSSSGAMFSIRHFKQLYKLTDISEPKAIGDLIRSSFLLMSVSTGFQNHVFRLWKEFLKEFSSDSLDINEFLAKLSMSKCTAVTKGNLSGFLSKLVYQIRCSIVHNKETEFHISAENYSKGCSLIMEEFLLPVLEELIFLLLSKENDLVWYQSSSIKLWDKSA